MDDGILSIDEMKTAAEDIKKLRPVQEAIMVALTLRSWEEIPDVLRSEVTAGNLARVFFFFFFNAAHIPKLTKLQYLQT